MGINVAGISPYKESNYGLKFPTFLFNFSVNVLIHPGHLGEEQVQFGQLD